MELITQKNSENDGVTVFCTKESRNKVTRPEYNSTKVSIVFQRE